VEIGKEKESRPYLSQTQTEELVKGAIRKNWSRSITRDLRTRYQSEKTRMLERTGTYSSLNKRKKIVLLRKKIDLQKLITWGRRANDTTF